MSWLKSCVIFKILCFVLFFTSSCKSSRRKTSIRESAASLSSNESSKEINKEETYNTTASDKDLSDKDLSDKDSQADENKKAEDEKLKDLKEEENKIKASEFFKMCELVKSKAYGNKKSAKDISIILDKIFKNKDIEKRDCLKKAKAINKSGELGLKSQGISSFLALSGLSIRILDLGDNKIIDLGPLANIPDLIQLNLSKNLLDEVSGLSPLTKLSILDLSFNNIQSIEELGDLTAITQLDLRGNAISDFEPIEKMEGIETLKIGSMRSAYLNKTNISFIPKLKKLKKLHIVNCEGEDVYHSIKKINYLNYLTLEKCTSIEERTKRYIQGMRVNLKIIN